MTDALGPVNVDNLPARRKAKTNQVPSSDNCADLLDTNACGYDDKRDENEVPICIILDNGEYKSKCKRISKVESLESDNKKSLVNCGCCSPKDEDGQPAYCD